MSLTLKSKLSKREVLVVFFDDEKKSLSRWNDKVLKDYVALALEQDFKGKARESLLVYSPSHPQAKRVLLVGMGKRSDIDLNQVRIAAATATKALAEREIRKGVSVLLPKVARKTNGDVLEAFETAAGLTQFDFSDFKTENGKKKKAQAPVEFDYILEDSKELKSAEKFADRGQIIAEGVNWGRELIATSPRQLYPDSLAKKVTAMVNKSPSKKKIRLKVWSEAELKRNKFGGVLAVGQGSDHPPRFIVLEYMNGRKSGKPVVLVGKGITFDSGGLSLKPPQAQETMKYDMAGAASVLSAFKIAVDLQLKVNVVALVPAAENMPSGKAQRPGDVITMANGKTVEVLNTDAEGRLVLADALHYASTHYKPQAIVDVATLTGACALAVGDAAAGIFSNDPKLLTKLQKSGDSVSENVWPLPDFDDFYKELLKSDVADIRNIGRRREGGATTAALFLEEFVSEESSWAHLDIAGCGWYDSPRDFVNSPGPSGVPIRLLADFVESNG